VELATSLRRRLVLDAASLRLGGCERRLLAHNFGYQIASVTEVIQSRRQSLEFRAKRMQYCGLHSAEVLGLDVADADIGGRLLKPARGTGDGGSTDQRVVPKYCSVVGG
jgi:hypothetical protein